MYQAPVRIHFDECDPAGILFYGKAIHLAHRQLEQYVESLGIAWTEWFNHNEWAVPIRHVEAEYLRPLVAGQIYTCELSVTEVGTSSVTFKTQFKDKKGQSCTQIISTHVFLDKSKWKKRAIPETLRERLEAEVSE